MRCSVPLLERAYTCGTLFSVLISFDLTAGGPHPPDDIITETHLQTDRNAWSYLAGNNFLRQVEEPDLNGWMGMRSYKSSA